MFNNLSMLFVKIDVFVNVAEQRKERINGMMKRQLSFRKYLIRTV